MRFRLGIDTFSELYSGDRAMNLLFRNSVTSSSVASLYNVSMPLNILEITAKFLNIRVSDALRYTASGCLFTIILVDPSSIWATSPNVIVFLLMSKLGLSF